MTRARSYRRLTSAIATGLAMACGGKGVSTGPTDSGPAVASVHVTPASGSIAAFGSTIQFTAVAKDAEGRPVSGKSFTWSSSDQTVATVTGGGVATALTDGAATITATSDGVEGSAELTVAQAVSSVTVTPAATNLTAVGATVQYSAAAADANGNEVAGSAVVWISSDELVATVDSTGFVTAMANGTATISATVDGIMGSASLSIAPAVASIEVTPAIGELNVIGSSLQFTAIAKDANDNPIAGKLFTWTSSDEMIASVDPMTGVATAIGSGTATITASADGVDGASSLTMNLTGTGSNTMLVIANVLANDVGGGLYTTNFNVTVTDASATPVSGATVTISNAALGQTVLTETGAGTGVYAASASEFPGGDFRLDVVRGSDRVEGVVARGPGVHTITSPGANDVVAAGDPLTVSWTVPSQAKFAEIETRDFSAGALLDDGSFVIQGVDNPANADQRIRLFRYNDVDIAGGLLGSRLQIKIRAQVEPVVVQ